MPFSNSKQDLRAFSRRAHKIARQVVVNAGAAAQNVAGTVLTTLVNTTPVGGPPTSPDDPHPRLARSNWLVSISSVSFGIPNFDARPPRSEGATIVEGLGQVAKARPEDTITIANGGDKVPYLGMLNRGWSTQAPAGFVYISIIAGIRALRKFKLLEGRSVSVRGRTVR